MDLRVIYGMKITSSRPNMLIEVWAEWAEWIEGIIYDIKIFNPGQIVAQTSSYYDVNICVKVCRPRPSSQVCFGIADHVL